MPRTNPLALAPNATLHLGDALATLAHIPDHSVDAVITDPPYAIKRIPTRAFARPATPQAECSTRACTPDRVCVPCVRTDAVAKFDQAPMLGQQSQNWHAKETHSRGYADNDPHQFQAWCDLWVAECYRVLKPGGHLVAFGGTRTWHRLAAAVEDAGFEIRDSLAWLYSSGMPKSLNVQRALTKIGHTSEAAAWSGWGTALKPAFEPIVLARRPLDGTMAENVTTWGVGPLNVTTDRDATDPASVDAQRSDSKWPSNVHLDDRQGIAASAERGQDATRFFWVSKPNKSERVTVDGVGHPTVKPLDLMQRLIRLVTPVDGTVLDPFAGSGTTLEACLIEDVRVIGIERDPACVPLIQARIARQSTDPSDRYNRSDPSAGDAQRTTGSNIATLF